MKLRDEQVRQQYEDFPYPHRAPEQERARLVRPPVDYLDKVNHCGWRGSRDLRQPLRALVAGGGTGDATIFLAHQLRETGGSVVHLDVSHASRAIVEQRAAIRGLENIDWISAPIEQLPELGLEPFDFIDCIGVLHHLADPAAGLRALRDVLDTDGVIALGVYGYYGRDAIRYTRRLLERMGAFDASPERRVEIANKVLDQLRPLHPFKSYRTSMHEQISRDPAELTDLLLHPRERSYTVGQFYDEIEGAGLQLASFTNFYHRGPPFKANYWAHTYLSDPDLLQIVAGLGARESAELAELLHGRLPFHTAYVSRHAGSVASPADTQRVPFYFVSPTSELVATLAAPEVSQVVLVDDHGSRLGLNLHAGVRDVLLAIDGGRTVAEVLDIVAAAPDVAAHSDPAGYARFIFEEVFNRLNEFDWLLLGSRAGPLHPVPDDALRFEMPAASA